VRSQLSPSCYKRHIRTGITQRPLRRPFLGSIRSGTLCAAIPLSKKSARKSSREPARFRSTVDSNGRTIWIVDAHGYGKRFIVRADEKLTAFLQLEREVLTVTFYLESIEQ
jgi:hypothetical protein